MEKMKKAMGVDQITQTILEMEGEGLYPIEYNLPYIIFGDEGKLATLNNPLLEARIDWKVKEYRHGLITVSNKGLSFKGLADLIEKGKGRRFYDQAEKGSDVVISFDQVRGILYITCGRDAYKNVKKLGIFQLQRVKKVLKYVERTKERDRVEKEIDRRLAKLRKPL